MKYKTKYVYSKDHLREEIKECEELGLTILVSKKVKTGVNKGAYEITTSEFRGEISVRGQIWDIVNALDIVNHPLAKDSDVRKVSETCFQELLKLAEKMNKEVE